MTSDGWKISRNHPTEQSATHRLPPDPQKAPVPIPPGTVLSAELLARLQRARIALHPAWTLGEFIEKLLSIGLDALFIGEASPPLGPPERPGRPEEPPEADREILSRLSSLPAEPADFSPPTEPSVRSNTAQAAPARLRTVLRRPEEDAWDVAP